MGEEFRRSVEEFVTKLNRALETLGYRVTAPGVGGSTG